MQWELINACRSWNATKHGISMWVRDDGCGRFAAEVLYPNGGRMFRTFSSQTGALEWCEILMRNKPSEEQPIQHGRSIVHQETKETLRDRFAMAALQGLITVGYKVDHWRIADTAYKYADEMMKVRDNSAETAPPAPQQAGAG